MGTIRTGSSDAARGAISHGTTGPQAQPRREDPHPHAAMGADRLSLGTPGASTAERSTGERIDHLAHTTHTPHGLMHTAEAGERAVHAAGRLARQAGRVASAGAEAAGDVHHLAHGHAGLFARLEGAVSGLVARGAAAMGAGLRAIPGGARAVDAAGRAGAAIGRLGEGLVAGTRLAGAGGRLAAAMGGRLPVVGAALGGVIAVADLRGARRILDDPHATPRDRIVAVGQAGLSVVSGVTGVGALALAGAMALGLTAPISVPLLLGASAITGVGAFAASFLLPAAH